MTVGKGVKGTWTFADLGGKITCDLFAGASPGNGGFAKYYDSRPVAENTVRTVNQYDMIPKAWVPANIDQVCTA
jgi:hypothetical protein